MTKTLFLITTLCTSIFFNGIAQIKELVNIGEPRVVELSDQVPETLTNGRSVVIIEIPDESVSGYSIRGDWKKLALEAHKTFRKIGVDAISYVYRDDLFAGPEVTHAYLKLLSRRGVRNVIYLKHDPSRNQRYTMICAPFDDDRLLKNKSIAWKQSHDELETIMLRMGRQVLRQELERSNFLITEKPEYLDDLVIFDGNRLENFPSRVKSLKLAVTKFQKVETDGITHENLLASIEKYNRSVDQKNEELASIMGDYPFDYELVDMVDDKEIYAAGYQYALMSISSTGLSIKRMLNYPSAANETHIMTSTYDGANKADLRRIPANANMTKYYIKQTIMNDIHSGYDWDADVSWQQGLKNFLFNLNVAF